MKFMRNKVLKAAVYPVFIVFFLFSFSPASHATDYHGHDINWTEARSSNGSVWYVCMHLVKWYTWEGCTEVYSHETSGQQYPVSCSVMGVPEGVWGCWAGPCTPACNCNSEVCDGQDNNCNGVIDEGFLKGVACSVGIGACKSNGVAVCSPDGTGTVCNATQGEPSPEVCDGEDNNCNGETDEGLSTDADEDGHYTPDSCQTPNDDCDDNDPAIYPGAPETCDSKDNNCNGAVDEACGGSKPAGSTGNPGSGGPTGGSDPGGPNGGPEPGGPAGGSGDPDSDDTCKK